MSSNVERLSATQEKNPNLGPNEISVGQTLTVNETIKFT
jgi:hypothetical protein